jgi:hypothetical protein
VSDNQKELKELTQAVSSLNGTISLKLGLFLESRLDRIAAALEKLVALKEKGQ